MRAPVGTALALCAALSGPAAAAPEDDPFVRKYHDIETRLLARMATPPALADLYELQDLLPRLPELASVATLLGEVTADLRAHGEVRALARWMLVEVEKARGRLPRARGHADRLGLLRDAWVVGPFDNEGRAGHAAVYPPEERIDLDGAYPGKEREVRWRRMTGLAPFGKLDLDAALRPRNDGTVYAYAVLDAPAAEDAALFFGAGGAVKLWVNGALVYEDPAQHPARFDQAACDLRLHAGPNAVLVKISAGKDAAALILRAADRGGRALQGAAWRNEVAREMGPWIAAPPALAPHAGALGELRKLAEKDAAAGLDLARVLALRRAHDDDDPAPLHAAEAAVRLHASGPPRRPAPASGIEAAEAQILVARFQELDQNQKRVAIEHALVAAPDHPEALEMLAGHHLGRGDAARALPLARRLLDREPRWWPARLIEAQAWDALGQGARAIEESLGAADAARTAPALRAAATAERRLGRDAGARRRLRLLLSLRYDDASARADLASSLVQSADLDGAQTLLQQAWGLDPGNIDARLQAADLASVNGRPPYDEARALYEAAERVAPEDDEVQERFARHLLRHGDEAGAVARLERALALRPQRPELRELLRAVRKEDRYAQPHLFDARERAALDAAPRPDEDAVVLGEATVVRVFANGLSSRTEQVVARVLNDRGADAWRSYGIRYTPDRQEVRVERARVVHADGTADEAHGEQERSLSEPWYNLYYDYRERVVSFPTLGPGDVVEVLYRIEDTGGENFFADYFGDVAYLQSTFRKLEARYVLIAPKERSFVWNEPSLHVDRSETDAPGGGRAYRVVARDVPRIVPEPSMPGWSEAAAYLHVSTYANWDAVGRFYAGLVQDQLRVTPDVARAADEAVAGIAPQDVAGKVRAIYAAVVKGTRYVGLEFGVHGWKPYRVDTVWSRRFGDCKDKAALLVAMLGQVGVEARMVLLRMRRLGDIAERPASLAVFNHAIAYVPSLNWWLDGTAEFHGADELPAEDRGAAVLVVEPPERSDGSGVAHGRFTHIPQATAAASGTDAVLRVRLAGDGSAQAGGETTVRGLAAPEYRRAYQSPAMRVKRFEQGYSRSYPGVRVESLEVSDPGELEKPFTASFALVMPAFADRGADGALAFTPFGRATRYAEAFAPLAQRTFDWVNAYPWRSTFLYEVSLPEHTEVAELPRDAEAAGPFGAWKVTWGQAEGRVVARAEVELSADRVKRADYAAFRAFLSALDEALARRVVAR